MDMNNATGRTADGFDLRDGMRVWTNDLRAGTVNLSAAFVEGHELWFDVLEDGRTVSDLVSESRVCVRHPFTGEPAPAASSGDFVADVLALVSPEDVATLEDVCEEIAHRTQTAYTVWDMLAESVIPAGLAGDASDTAERLAALVAEVAASERELALEMMAEYPTAQVSE